MLVAWFLILILPGQDHPVLRGPFLAITDCLEVRLYFESEGHLTGGCELMSLPQDTDARDFNGEPYLPVDRQPMP